MVTNGGIFAKKYPRTEVRGSRWSAENYSPRLRFQRSSKTFRDGGRLVDVAPGFEGFCGFKLELATITPVSITMNAKTPKNAT